MNQEKKIYPGMILDKLIAASAAYKVACPVCGALDNRWEERAGHKAEEIEAILAEARGEAR